MPAKPFESETMASAALRHLRDARRLLTQQDGFPASPDQAWHLAGFGPECARKAAITSAPLARILGHDIADAALTGWLLALDVRAPAEARTPATLGDWRPDHRYDSTGTRSADTARELLDRCDADALRVLARLWTAGALNGARC